jgi:GR25 family glycosyltransferase involved in LPS biosynthesis
MLTDGFCINLKSRMERWRSIRDQISRFPSDFSLHRFDAIENKSSPRTGCAESHISLIDSAKSSGREFVLVLEDDVEFVDSAFDHLSMAISEAPNDWDVLFGGYYDAHLWRKCNKYYYKTYYAQGTHCVVYRKTAYNVLCAYDKEPLGIDDYISYLAATKQINLYLLHPLVAKQSAGYSDIKNTFFDWDDSNYTLNADYQYFGKFFGALFENDIGLMEDCSEKLGDSYFREQAYIMFHKYQRERGNIVNIELNRLHGDGSHLVDGR